MLQTMLKLRTGSLDDVERIAKLQLASWRVTYAAELSRALLENQDVADWADDWRRCMAAGERVILAEDGDALAGFVACGPARGATTADAEWEIYNIHVAPDLHGRGIGGKLLEAAAALGREYGARQLVLWVVETNQTARRFYESKGMRWDGGAQDAPMETEMLHEVRYRRVL
ncbi:MAG TPA: N-acetyltransferase [Gemmatimonadaceae bacterium]